MLNKRNQFVKRKEVVVSLNSTLQSIDKKHLNYSKRKMSLSKMFEKLGSSRSTIRNMLKDLKKPILNYKRKKDRIEHLYNVF